MSSTRDTIAAIATATGRGGIGVIRVSGRQAKAISQALTGVELKPRNATTVRFRTSKNELIDKGIAIYFDSPFSYTGEDVLECHAHGSHIVQNMLLDEIIGLGARTARPGEFTERAFLNDKLDLVQAEAIADLVDSRSKKAARCAMRSLDGAFSRSILAIRERLLDARGLIESSLDFPDEEDVVIELEPVIKRLENSHADLNRLLQHAEAGRVLENSPLIVITGPPNAGKSSIINRLSGIDSAIVSETPGTTRDIIKENVLLGGNNFTLIDTAGLRDTDNDIELEGIKRARKYLAQADLALFVFDLSAADKLNPDEYDQYRPGSIKTVRVWNKTDLCDDTRIENTDDEVFVSAKTGRGFDLLINRIIESSALMDTGENLIFARQRHVDALGVVRDALEKALRCFARGAGLEEVAEHLRLSLAGLDEITGKTTTDAVLDVIFSRFCVGK